MFRLPPFFSRLRPLFWLGLVVLAGWLGQSWLPSRLLAPKGGPQAEAVSAPEAIPSDSTVTEAAPSVSDSDHATRLPPAAKAPAPAAATGFSKLSPAHRAALASAPEDLRAGRPFALAEGGRVGRFKLALDEIYNGKAPVHQRLKKIKPQADASALLHLAEEEAARNGQWPGLVIYPENGPVDAAHRRVLTEKVLLNSAQLATTEQFAREQALEVKSRPSYAPTHVVATASTPLRAMDAMSVLAMNEQAAAEPLLLSQRFADAVQDDYYYRDQWHLRNTGQSGGKKGVDINVEPVWDEFQGQNIRIGIVDDSLQITHPDLSPNVDPLPNHYDWNGEDSNPSPDGPEDYHGTPVGGLAAARGNNGIGVAGTAPQATLVGMRLIADLIDSALEGEAMIHGQDVIQIKNNSWGMGGGPYDLGYTGSLFTSSMIEATTDGRGGRGTVFVWSGGNGRGQGMQGNKDGYANNIYGITVGAVDHNGALTSYSEIGSHITVVAPSIGRSGGIITTDLVGVQGYNQGSKKNLAEVNYTNDFGGTSAAAPIVSGVVALMLQANPNLGWRDVKEILLRSSTKLAPKDAGWVEHPNRDPWEINYAPVKHHHSYGGGLVNAAAAVAMARTWTNLGESFSVSREQVRVDPNPGDGPQPQGTTIILPEETKTKYINTRLKTDFRSEMALRVESVTVSLEAKHERRGDLIVRLISPSGVVSTLAYASKLDTGKDYSSWTFSTVRHWGESSRGEWTVVTSEVDDDINGEVIAVDVTLRGTAYPAIELTTAPVPQIVPEGSSLTLTGDSTVFGKTTRQWLKNGKPIPGATGTSLSFPSMQFGDAARYAFTAENLTAQIESPAPVAVVRQNILSQNVLPGQTAMFKVFAAGPNLRYQWFSGSRQLRDDDPDFGGRLKGSREPVMTLRRVTAADAADFHCRISMDDVAPFFTSRASLSITIPPEFDIFIPPSDGIVSGAVNFQILASNTATRYSAKGLPPGLKLDAKTGRITGRPTRAGSYTVTLTAGNAAGSAAAPVTFDWVVEDLPANISGSFRGLVERHAGYNQNLGGHFSLVVTKTGAFTGTLTRGSLRTAVKGMLETFPGETYATVTLPVSRPGNPLPLELTFSLEDGTLEGSLGREDEDYVRVWAAQEWTALPQEFTALPGLYNVPLVPTPLPDSPRGSGYLAVNLSSKGQITWSGKLADGTAVTGAGKGLRGDLLPVHSLLYKGTGSFQGQLQILPAAPARIAAATDWFKAAQPGNPAPRNYGSGFGRHDLAGEGQRYQPPANLVLELPLTANNARLRFSEGGLFIPFSQTFTVAAGNVAQFTPGLATNPHQLKLSLNAKLGLLTGSGTAMDIDPNNPALSRQRPGTFQGLIIQGLERAEGFFLLPSNATPTAPINSGRFIMTRNIPD
ncbi:MAG TPA: S8 family serine peptidase [Prosthecobacter sp.]